VDFYRAEDRIAWRIWLALFAIDPESGAPKEGETLPRVFYTYIVNEGTVTPIVAGSGVTPENYPLFCRAIVDAVLLG